MENMPQMYSTSNMHNFDLRTFTVTINCSYIYFAAVAADSVLVVRSGYARMWHEACLHKHPATRKESTQKRYFNVVVECHHYTFSCSENVTNFRI